MRRQSRLRRKLASFFKKGAAAHTHRTTPIPSPRAARACIGYDESIPMGAASVDVKKTVNLPKTDFPMKANLAQMEPKTLLRWETENLYAKIRAARAGSP